MSNAESGSPHYSPKSVQESAQSSGQVRQHAPPQSVISKMSCWGWKKSGILQPAAGQLPTGVPKVVVSIVLSLFDNALGIWERWMIGVRMSCGPNEGYHQLGRTIY